MKDAIKIIIFVIIIIFLLIAHFLFLFSDKYYEELRNLFEIVLIIYSFFFMCIFLFRLFFKKPEKILLFFKIGILIFLFYFTKTSLKIGREIISAKEEKKIRLTMAEIRNMAMLIEDYYEENGSYPFPYYKGSAKILLKLFKNIRYGDGWGNEILYWCFDNGKSYIFQSPGRDKKFERIYFGIERKKYELPEKGCFYFSIFYVTNGGIFSTPDKDTVFYNGVFEKWYEGACNTPRDDNLELYIKEYLNNLPDLKANDSKY